MFSIRLAADLAAEIQRIAAAENRTTTEIAEEAIRAYLASHPRRQSSYELGKDLFGAVDSGDPEGSRTHRQAVGRKLREKHRR